MNGGEAPLPIHATLGELIPLLTSGVLSAEALLAACLAQIAAHDRDGAALSAMRCLNPQAEAEAQALDRERACGKLRGPLHGVPMVLKDNIDLAGLPTTSGCRALAGAMPLRDAEQTRRLRQAGAVIVGKTNLSEFSFEIRSRSSLGGDVVNPFAFGAASGGITAGGSSGGTAAAVAAGFAVAGLGTDTGGSIRTPASFNGLVGLRPTKGLLDLRGVAPLAPSTDTVGPIARSVADIARLLEVMSSTRVALPARSLRGARIGVARQAFGMDEEVVNTIQHALDVMAESSAIIVDPARLPPDLLPTEGPHIVDWEFHAAFDRYLASNFVAGTAPASLADLYAQGNYLPEYRDVLERRISAMDPDSTVHRSIVVRHRELRAAILAALNEQALDVLVYPTAAVLPTSLENPPAGWAPELAACSGLPALTIPVGQGRSGLPIGLEFLGRDFAEPLLIVLAGALASQLGERPVCNLRDR